jgi:hypothetical protein
MGAGERPTQKALSSLIRVRGWIVCAAGQSAPINPTFASAHARLTEKSAICIGFGPIGATLDGCHCWVKAADQPTSKLRLLYPRALL